MYSKKRQFGNIGEDIVANHLVRKGYSIIGRNYLKKYGEIDIIARFGSNIHFFEVKTVSRDTDIAKLSRGTWMPEDNVHQLKLRKIARVIESWLLENEYDGYWQLDVASVYFNPILKKGRIRILENVIIS